MKIIMSTLLGLSAMSALAEESCPPLKIAALREQLREKPADELVFFASWCLSCKEHLRQLDSQKVYIASSDEREAANKIFDHFRTSSSSSSSPRCYWDEDGSISAFYEVKGLPAKRVPAAYDKR